MLRRTAKAIGVTTALTTLTGSAYIFSDPGARRTLDFWSRLGPIVGSYTYTHVHCKYYLKSTTQERTQAFARLHELSAPKVLQAIVELRGIFIKAGQYLSVRPEITPEPYRRAFKQLQTSAPSEPIDVILGIIEKELGRPIAEVFETVEAQPCGAASTAQAHIATLKENGKTVVIKIQYPDAKAWFNSDITALNQMARLINKMDDSVDQEELEPILNEFSKQFLAEFDYVSEQNYMMDIGNALRESGKYTKTVIVPTVLPHLCTGKMITMTYLPGHTLEQRANVLLKKSGIDLKQGIGNFLKDQEKDTTNKKDLENESSGGSSSRHVGTMALQMIGPDVALRLWSMVDAVVTTWHRFAVFILLDVFHLSPRLSTTMNPGKEETSVPTTTLPTISPDIEPWGAWAHRTRRELNEMNDLAHINGWIDTLFDVHGYEVFHIGIFNGDPHPGNILVVDGLNGDSATNALNTSSSSVAALGLIDYGQCKRLSKESQYTLAKLIVQVANKNSTDQEVADAFRAVGAVTINDSTYFLATMARLMLGKLKSEHMNHDFHMNLHQTDRMTQFPPDMMIMVRVAMLLRGLGLLLKQNISVSERWQPEAEKCIARYGQLMDMESKAMVPTTPLATSLFVSRSPSQMTTMLQRCWPILASLALPSSLRWFGTSSSSSSSSFTPPASPTSSSPYALFNVKTNASEKEIRTKFRELAYEHHPDLNPNADENAMKEIVEAYQILLSNTGVGGAARDSSVGINVEKFTIRELMNDEKHNVITCIVSLDHLVESGGKGLGGVEESKETFSATKEDSGKSGESSTSAVADTVPRINASMYDSIADLKRDIQHRYGAEWNLNDRRLDQEQVAIGWELVHDGDVLCPNYFLSDYNITTGDRIHVVIRTYDEELQ